jgi:hypothetical protein
VFPAECTEDASVSAAGEGAEEEETFYKAKHLSLQPRQDALMCHKKDSRNV